MADAPRITPHQGLCVNALAHAVTGLFEDADTRLSLDLLSEHLPHAANAPAALQVHDVLVAAKALLACRDRRAGPEHAGARFAAQEALGRFFFWRMAAARDALHPLPTPAPEAAA
jgi:hypothetical protein